MSDPYRLTRFVEAQNPVMRQVEAELRAGAKRSHWMWFVFPQLAGLGHSATARHFGITCLSEARAYLAHPVLSLRLLHCTQLVNGVVGRSAHDIFGPPDDLKFRSCMTLFAAASPDQHAFTAALERYFRGENDENTQRLLSLG